ncbi:MAG: hypothetical protein LBK77_05255 [Spirochaetaceae bacterium]|jgi:hypothetical protein|nr:hypothetical protein [Spirochaetaceae bacterium]
MLCCSSCPGKSVPKEYRQAAEALFPAEMTARDPGAAVPVFADVLGVGADYRKLDAGWGNPAELQKFLLSFQNNLDLLIQKTWVEKADEDRKEKLQNRVPGFIALIEAGDYNKALAEFGAILEELAWLLFGPQSRREDFVEYASRIDSQLGLFWWYAGQLERFLAAGPWDQAALKPVLILGICYVTDF